MSCRHCLACQELMRLEKPPPCWMCGSAFDAAADVGDGRADKYRAARQLELPFPDAGDADQ